MDKVNADRSQFSLFEFLIFPSCRVGKSLQPDRDKWHKCKLGIWGEILTAFLLAHLQQKSPLWLLKYPKNQLPGGDHKAGFGKVTMANTSCWHHHLLEEPHRASFRKLWQQLKGGCLDNPNIRHGMSPYWEKSSWACAGDWESQACLQAHLKPNSPRGVGFSSSLDFLMVKGGELVWVCWLLTSSVIMYWGLPRWTRGSCHCRLGTDLKLWFRLGAKRHNRVNKLFDVSSKGSRKCYDWGLLLLGKLNTHLRNDYKESTG